MTDIDTIPESQIEAAIAELETPLALTIQLSGEEKKRLQRVAADAGTTEDGFVLTLIREHINSRIGAATIKSATSYATKVTGPSGSVSRG